MILTVSPTPTSTIPATGHVSLLSTGTGSQSASFVDASADGEDVFILTRQRLVGADRDGYIDLYDVRGDGGFPEPPAPAPPCAEETCRGGLSSVPGSSRPGSATLRGAVPSSRPVTPHASLRLLARSVRGASAILRLSSSGPGVVSWSGTGIRHATHRLSAAGRFVARVTLTAHARAALTRRHAYRARISLTLTPPGGPPVSVAVVLTFNRSPKKGR